MKNDSSYESRLADSYSEAASSLSSAGFTNLSGSDTFSTSTGQSTGTTADSGNAQGTSDATSGFGGGLGGTGGRDASGALGGGGSAFDSVLFNPTLLSDNGGLLQSFDPQAASQSEAATVAQPSSVQTNTIGAGGVNPGGSGSYVNTTDAYASPLGVGGAATKRASTFDTSSFTIGGPRVVKVVSAGKGWTKVQLADGSVELRNGDRASRNFNPGNIEYNEFSNSGGPGFAPSNGAVGTDGRFAVFPTREMGLAAQQNLLFGKEKYNKLTIAEAINEYAPPNENDTGAYIRSVAAAAGVPTDTVLRDMTPAQQKAMIEGMHRVEGNTGYKTTKIRESDYIPTDTFSTGGDQEIAMFEPGAVIDDIDRPGSAANPKGKVYDVDRPGSAQPKETQTASLVAPNADEQSRVAPDAATVKTISITPTGETESPRDPVERLVSIYLTPHSTQSELAAQSGQEAIRAVLNVDGSARLGGAGNAANTIAPDGRKVRTTSISAEPSEPAAPSEEGASLTPSAPGDPSAPDVRTVAITSETGTPATATHNPTSKNGEIVPASEATPVDASEGITINPTAGKVVETVVDLATGVNPIFGALNLASGLAGGPTAGKLAMKGFEWALNHPGEKELLERSARVDGTVNGNGDEPLNPVQTPTEDAPEETEEERLVSHYLNPVDEIWRPKPHERWGPDSRRYR